MKKLAFALLLALGATRLGAQVEAPATDAAKNDPIAAELTAALTEASQSADVEKSIARLDLSSEEKAATRSFLKSKLFWGSVAGVVVTYFAVGGLSYLLQDKATFIKAVWDYGYAKVGSGFAGAATATGSWICDNKVKTALMVACVIALVVVACDLTSKKSYIKGLFAKKDPKTDVVVA
jgi:hypothetical protein